MIKITNLKKRIFPLAIFVTITILFSLPLFKNQFYNSHDGEAHVARFGAYAKAFDDFQLPIRWAGDLNYRYGLPVFIFFYPLPGTISIPIGKITTLENTFKIIIISSFFLSFASFYFYSLNLFKDRLLATSGGILYGLVPYNFLNLYVRGDVAEMLALSIVPFVFYFIDKSYKEENIFPIIWGSIFYSLVILSHNGVSLLFSPIILLYSIFRLRSRRKVLKSLSIILLGLLLSAFFWLPAIIESKYTNINLFAGGVYKEHFPSFLKLIYSEWGFGADVNNPGGLSPQIGAINALLVIGSVLVLLKNINRKFKELTCFWLLVLLGFLFLTLKESSFFWSAIPLIDKLQFPWRMIGVISFATAALGTLLLSQVSLRFRFFIVIAVILYSMQFLKINYINSKPDKYYMDYPGVTYYYGEASPIWTAGDFSSFPKSSFEIISGKGEITSSIRRSNVHTIETHAEMPLRLVDNTVYFPGWQVKVNGEKVPIEFQDPNYRGLITFNVPEGINRSEVKFTESPIRFISDLITLASILIIILLIFFRVRVYGFIQKV